MKIFDENGVRIWGAILLGVVFLGPASCVAQFDPEPQPALTLHPFTVYGGVGVAPVSGADGHNLNRALNFQFGAGHATPIRWWYRDTFPNPSYKTSPRAVLYLNCNFLFDQSQITAQAIQQAIAANPQNTALLSAHSGQAKFFSATIDPTVRFAATERWSVYVLGGFGWLRRNIDLSGVSTQGTLLQPASPAVFGTGGSSGAFGGGGGVDFGVGHHGAGAKVYFETRFLRGLGVNSGTTLAPLSAGLRW